MADIEEPLVQLGGYTGEVRHEAADYVTQTNRKTGVVSRLWGVEVHSFVVSWAC